MMIFQIFTLKMIAKLKVCQIESLIVFKSLLMEKNDYFSGGPAKGRKILDEIQAIANGGGFGSIVGREFFSRPFDEGLSLMGRNYGYL